MTPILLPPPARFVASYAFSLPGGDVVRVAEREDWIRYDKALRKRARKNLARRAHHNQPKETR